jgi:hypothetical protein
MSCQDERRYFFDAQYSCLYECTRVNIDFVMPLRQERGASNHRTFLFGVKGTATIRFCDWQLGMPAKSKNAFQIFSTAREPRNPSAVADTAAGACFTSDMS